MNLRRVIALTALAAVFLPVSGMAVTQKIVRNYKTKAPQHDHLKMGKHSNEHSKQFASAVKEHGKRAKGLRDKSADDKFGVHKVK